MESPGPVRADAWTWSVRFYKTRSLASAACKAGHVKINGSKAKPASTIKVGDKVEALTDGGPRVAVVRKLISKRVGATVAAEAFEDRSPPPPSREELALFAVRDRGAGRPTKRDRRVMDKFQQRGY